MCSNADATSNHDDESPPLRPPPPPPLDVTRSRRHRLAVEQVAAPLLALAVGLFSGYGLGMGTVAGPNSSPGPILGGVGEGRGAAPAAGEIIRDVETIALTVEERRGRWWSRRLPRETQSEEEVVMAEPRRWLGKEDEGRWSGGVGDGHAESGSSIIIGRRALLVETQELVALAEQEEAKKEEVAVVWQQSENEQKIQEEGGGEEEKDEEGEGEGEREEEEEGEEGSMVESASILCIILVLILLTIGFEKTKEMMEEHADCNMRPMIESLFGEMTVLGFLSVFTFVVSNTHFFNLLSVRLFGEGEEEKLLEIFEFVHYTLFFVMIFFVVQVLSLFNQGNETVQQWRKIDRACRDELFMTAVRSKYESSLRTREMRRSTSFNSLFHAANSALLYLPLLRNVRREETEDLLRFRALRREFILERSYKPPFAPQDPSKRVADDFNFGAYLSICLGKTLVHIVEVEILTWVFFAVLAILFFFVYLLAGRDMVVMAWVWASLGWAAFLFNIHFEKHLVDVRAAFAPLLERTDLGNLSGSTMSSAEDLVTVGETTYLIPPSRAPLGKDKFEEVLPDWCKVDMQDYMSNRPWFVRIINGPAEPEPQHTLFWFERKGPMGCMLVLQINLVFTGVHCALLLLTFLGTMFREVGITVFIAYFITSVLPILAIMGNKKHIISIVAQVTSIGNLRQDPAIADVVREEKTATAVRTFVVLCKMHRAIEECHVNVNSRLKNRSSLCGRGRGSGCGRASLIGHLQTRHYRKALDKIEVEEVARTFDVLNESRDGGISIDEFEILMQKVGVQLTPEKLHELIAIFDTDGDGEVSKEEFLQWYANSMHDELSIKEQAHFVFQFFDRADSGDITVAEFKTTLDALNMNFTFDEIGEIVKELDKEGKGVIGEEEFEQLLKKYRPKELGRAQRHPSLITTLHELT